MPFEDHQEQPPPVGTDFAYDDEFLSPEQRATAIAKVLADIALDALRPVPGEAVMPKEAPYEEHASPL